ICAWPQNWVKLAMSRSPLPININSPKTSSPSRERNGSISLCTTPATLRSPGRSSVSLPRRPNMNAKAKGARNERKSMAVLEAAGYSCVRSSASLGAFDIVGIGSTDIVLCQVKTRDFPSAVEMERIKLFPAPPNVRKLIHRWKDGQPFPDVKE